MVTLTTARPFWQAKAEYAGFAEFLSEAALGEDHGRDSRRGAVASGPAGRASARLVQHRGALANRKH